MKHVIQSVGEDPEHVLQEAWHAKVASFSLANRTKNLIYQRMRNQSSTLMEQYNLDIDYLRDHYTSHSLRGTLTKL